MIVADRRGADPLEQIDCAVAAEAGAGKAGRRIDREQAAVDRRGIDPFGAKRGCVGGSVLEICDPAAGLAEHAIDAGVRGKAPDLLAAFGIKRDDVVVAGANE